MNPQTSPSEEVTVIRLLRAENCRPAPGGGKWLTLLFVRNGSLLVNGTHLLSGGQLMLLAEPMAGATSQKVSAWQINIAEPVLRLVAEFGDFPEVCHQLSGENVRVTLDSFAAAEFSRKAWAIQCAAAGRQKRNLLALFDIAFPRDAEPRAGQTDPEWFSDLMQLLPSYANVHGGTMAAVATTGKSYEYVSRYFSRKLGQTLTEYMNRQRILKACELLKGSDKELCDIADDSGFDNLSTFYHVFKSQTGFTPCGFRKNADGHIIRNQVE